MDVASSNDDMSDLPSTLRSLVNSDPEHFRSLQRYIHDPPCHDMAIIYDSTFTVSRGSHKFTDWLMRHGFTMNTRDPLRNSQRWDELREIVGLRATINNANEATEYKSTD